MSRKFLTSIDLNGNQLLNVVIQVLASDPGSPTEGQIWYNSTTHQLKYQSNAGTQVIGTGSGSGDFSSNTSTSVDGEVVVFSGTAGKTGKRATGSGLAKLASGVLGTATLGTDYAGPTSGSGILKGNGSGGFSTAVADTDYATPSYVINQLNLQDVKTSVRAATTATGTLASAYANGSTVDGVTLATGDRILIKNQTSATENGIYVVAASGAPARATDADASGELSAGTVTYVESGTANAGITFGVSSTTASPWVPGSSGSTWVAIAGITSVTAGNGLTASGGAFAVGAGNFITVGADTVGVTTWAADGTAAMTRTLTGTNTLSAATSFTVTHSFGHQRVGCQVFDSGGVQVDCTVTQTSTTVLTVSFDVANSSTWNWQVWG